MRTLGLAATAGVACSADAKPSVAELRAVGRRGRARVEQQRAYEANDLDRWRLTDARIESTRQHDLIARGAANEARCTATLARVEEARGAGPVCAPTDP